MSEEKTGKRLELMDELTDLWLHGMKDKLQCGDMTPTDYATLARFLMANGVTLDPTRLPQDLADKVTQRVNYDDDPDVG